MSSRIVLVGGGVRSGKSAFALRHARAMGPRRAFVATAQPIDDEMRARIEAHRAERGADFRTIEEPRDLARAVMESRSLDVVVVDCLTLWLSNLVLAGESDAAIRDRVEALVRALHESSASCVLVTNEVGMGIVPENALARRFRDLAGSTHRRVAGVAHDLYFAAMGVVVRLKPSPVEVVA